jgi:hypothetical protein
MFFQRLSPLVRASTHFRMKGGPLGIWLPTLDELRTVTTDHYRTPDALDTLIGCIGRIVSRPAWVQGGYYFDYRSTLDWNNPHDEIQNIEVSVSRDLAMGKRTSPSARETRPAGLGHDALIYEKLTPPP